jgi:hypothetical protein
MLTFTLAALVVNARWPPHSEAAAADELKVPDNVPTDQSDFEAKGIEGWTTVSGRWAVEAMAGAASGKRVLVQRATNNEFNVIVAPPGPYSDVDVSMKFKPISGREDASGGIVFRFGAGKYYVVLANALEDNFRLYYYDRGRRQLASASVKAPALGQCHTLRVVAVGDRVQAWLDTKAIEQALGRSGQDVGAGVFQVTVSRAEAITEMGQPLLPAMGVVTLMNFQPTSDGKAAITGDFVLIDKEVNAVAKTLRRHGVDVTAIHNHALVDTPRLFYMHFWANDDPVKRAQALKAALDQTNSRK